VRGRRGFNRSVCFHWRDMSYAGPAPAHGDFPHDSDDPYYQQKQQHRQQEISN